MARIARHLRTTTVLTAVLGLTLLGYATPARAADGPNGKFTATPLTPSSVIQGTKSASGRLAESDQGLLQRTDADSVNVMVKLDYDAAAGYTGGIKDLRPTSPSVTGKKLTGTSSEEKDYEGYVEGIESTFRHELATKVPGAKVGTALRTVYGGVAVRLPAKDAKTLATLPGVAAVQSDKLEKPTADSRSPRVHWCADPVEPARRPGSRRQGGHLRRH